MIASTPAPVPAPEIDRVVVLTPLGYALVSVYRLRRQLAALPDADRRAIIRELLAVEPPRGRLPCGWRHQTVGASMSTFETLAQDNPNVRAQYDEWREQTAANGEDSTDWDAFRDHVMAIGAPDPGLVPPDDFVGEDWKAENPDWVARYAGR